MAVDDALHPAARAVGEALDGRQLALGGRRPGDGLSDGIVDDAPALAQPDLGLAIAI